MKKKISTLLLMATLMVAMMPVTMFSAFADSNPQVIETYYEDNNNVVLIFDKDVQLTADAKSPTALSSSTDVVPWKDGDSMTSSGNEVHLHLADANSFASKITFKPGSLTSGGSPVTSSPYGNFQTMVTIKAINTKASYPSAGGEISFTVSGGMLSNTMKAAVMEKSDDGTFKTSDVVATFNAKSSTSATVTATFPENTTDKEKVYKLKLTGYKHSWDWMTTKLAESNEFSIAAPSSGPSVPVDSFDATIESAAYNGPNSIIVVLDKSVKLAGNAKDLICFTDADKETEKSIVQTDSVSANNNKIIIDMKDPSVYNNYPYIKIKKGALLNDDNAVLSKNLVYYLSLDATIHDIYYSTPVTFDHNGGHVIARIDGAWLDKGMEGTGKSPIKVTVSGTDGSTLNPELEVNKFNGAIASLSFDLPDNKTDKTITYRVSFKKDFTPIYDTYIQGGKEELSVMSKNATSFNDTTISGIVISGASDVDPAPDKYETTMTGADYTLKLGLDISGTNLSAKNTVIRIVDENGVYWPIIPAYECGAGIRWQTQSAYVADNPEKNRQHIELMPPRTLGHDRTYTLSFSVDGGKTFLDSPVGKVTIHNDGIIDPNYGFSSP